jgi:SOS-response transcriptional repressor LexA
MDALSCRRVSFLVTENKMRTKDPNALTVKQKDILTYIARSINRHGYQPAIREIGEEFGIRSPNGVMFHLRSMQRKGHIKMTPQMARAISFQWKDYI